MKIILSNSSAIISFGSISSLHLIKSNYPFISTFICFANTSEERLFICFVSFWNKFISLEYIL